MEAEDRPHRTEGRPTLRTIAFMTGLGVTTVSRALNDAPDIGQATKERVRLVARQIGYRPNRAGVRLRTGRTNVISLVLSVDTDVLGLTPHIVHGISAHLAGTPYHLVVTPYQLGEDPLDPVRYVCETGSADGVIFSRTEPEDARVRYLTAQGLPFATHGRTETGIDHPFFDFDNTRFAEIAVGRLARRGRRRLALLAPPGRYTYTRHMVRGFLAALERHDLVEVPIHELDTDTPSDAIEAEIARLMRSRHPPDGIVCASASAAIATVVGAETAGFEIGRDLDIATKESFNLMRKFRRPIEVVKEDFRLAGTALARSVLGAIAGRPIAELQTLVVPEEE